MPEGNPLVAESKKDGNGPGPLTAGNGDYGYAGGIGVAESAMDTFNGIKDGDWISGGLGMLSLAGEVASAATDPFGYLMSSVASFLMEHIQPLKDMLDSIAGDPPVIQSYSDTWGNVSKALGERKTDLDNAVKNGTTGWSGAAADAYRKQAAEHGEALTAAATVAGGISTAVMVFGQIVSFVRETVRQLIADLVGKLISWVMEEVFSLGFGTPVVVAQATTAIAKWGERIAGDLKKLTDAIRRISPLISKLMDIFEKIAKIFGKVLGKVSGLDGVKIKEGGFARRIPKDEGGGVHARAHGEGGEGGSRGGDGEGGSHGEGDSSHGGEGDSSPDGDGSHGGDGENSPSGSDSPSSDPDSSSTGGDSGSRRSSGRDDGSPSSARGEDGAPTHSGDGDGTPSSSHPDNLASSPSARSSDGASPSHRSGGDSGPSTHAGDSSPAPTHAGDSSPSPTRGAGDNSPSPARHAGDNGPAPTHAGDSSPSPTRGAGDSSPSPARHAGDNAPTHAGDSSPSPTHAGESPPSARSAAPSHTDGGGAPSTGRTDSPSTHGGGETTSSAAPPRTGDGTTASGTAPATPRTGDPAPSGVPSPRGGDGASVPPQGGMMGGGMPPGGAPGGAGGLGGSPGRTGGGGAWTGTPGSPGAHTPHVPEPSARPRPGGTPDPVARGPQGTTTPTHGPGTRPGGNGPGGRPNGPGHTGPGGAHGPGDSTPGHHGPGDNSGAPHHEPDGGPPHDPDGPHHEPLSPDEVNARHAEDTPAGSSYHGGDPEMGDLPHRVLPDPDGRYTVDVHVTKDGYARIGDRLYTPEEFADILRRNGTYDGRPIRLIGCDAGSNDFAHRLSRELDTEVMAPNKPAWTDSHGRVFSSDYEIGPDGNMRPRIPPDGEWSNHHPDGSTHRAGDDGFAPDGHHHDPHDVDADSARHRGDGAPDPDQVPKDRNPDSRRQEEDLTDAQKQADRRANPQSVTDFDPPHGTGVDVQPGHANPDGIHSPSAHERFPGDQTLQPNREYKVVDADGNVRGTYHTDADGRVTHIDTSHPNEHPRVKGQPNDNYHPNPDLTHPHPDTTYRVEIDGQHQTFHTDADGIPNPSAEFHRPDFEGDPVPVGRDHALAPKKDVSFAEGGPYEPHTRYEVTGKDGVPRGTFYTDANGHVRWADVESGRIARVNPDVPAIARHAPDAPVHYQQRFDPNSTHPPGETGSHHYRVEETPLDAKKRFLDEHPPPLEPNSKYVVNSDYKAESGKTETHTRSVYWTDEHGNIKAVETFRPHNPELNRPQPDMVYNVDDGKFVYHTGHEDPNAKGYYRTDTTNGTAHNQQIREEDALPARDATAQSQSGRLGSDLGDYDGGHMSANQMDSPGELTNMMTQWRPQNQGWTNSVGEANWRAMEADIAKFTEAGGKVEQFDVFPIRPDAHRAPETIQVRWVEVDTQGNRSVHIRSFENRP